MKYNDILKQRGTSNYYMSDPWTFKEFDTSYVISIEISKKTYFLHESDGDITTWSTKKGKAKRFYTIQQIETYIRRDMKNREDLDITQI